MDIFEDQFSKVLQEIKDARFLSVMIDGATDAATLEMEMVYIRYLKKGQARNTFLSIEDVKHANAQGVLQTITCVSVNVCVQLDDRTWKITDCDCF